MTDERTILPTVSVLMSVRNGLPYVREAVDSIIRQTFTNWEFIINDNLSTDGTGEYLQQAAKAEPRIKLLRGTNDLGCAGGFNNAMASAVGKWVAIIDADDRAMPQRLERQLAFVRSHPEVKAISSLAYYIDDLGRQVGKTYHDLTTPEAFRHYMANNEAIGILNPGAFIDRKTFVEMGGYREAFYPAEDIDLWARISELGMILVQPEFLMEYRVHATQSVTQSFLLARMKYEWSRVCMTERRSSRSEPSWDQFLADWNGQAWYRRLNRWRKITAKRLYRQAGFHWISGRRLIAAREFGAGSILQPGYTLSRLKGQLLR